MSVITRFAPSPTGSLHIGGARTALFNYIYAKSNNGIFKIRIEDTDKLRNIKTSVDSIIDGLNWLGLKTNEKIIFQSKNISNHVEIVKKMIDENLAYRCFHTEEEINEKEKKIKNLKVNGETKNKIKLSTKNFVLE